MTHFRTTLCLLLALGLLGAGTIVVPATVGEVPAVLAGNGDDEDGNGNGGEDDGGDGGNGGDGEGGNGGDNGDGGDDGNGRGEGGNGDGGEGAIEQAAPYRVEVACAYDEAADETTCSFTGVAPPEAKDVGHVDLPESEVCAEVVGGDAEYVDSDPNTRVVGYKSRGSEGAFSLVLTGEVTVGGTATYWFKTGDGVFPATGPGLLCGDEAAQPVAEITVEADAEITVEARVTVVLEPRPTGEAAQTGEGAIVVQIYACIEETPPAEFDWYGACEPAAEGVALTLEARQETELVVAGEGTTDAAGQIRFEGLVATTYHLDAPDAVWCHAESDKVDEHGELVVEADAEVTVWVFFCGGVVVK